MSKPTSAVKDRWNRKAYDLISLRVKKGDKEIIAKRAAEKCLSLNKYIINLIAADAKSPPSD